MKKVEIFKDGKDNGFIFSNGSIWWFDPNFKDSFEIFDLDSFYPKDILKDIAPTQEAIDDYIYSVINNSKKYINRDITSVVDFGCRGGHYIKRFLELGIDAVGVEGTTGGYETMLEIGIPNNKAYLLDLRRYISLNRKFDVAICTEVAEHLEPPFSSQLVNTLTSHSDVIFFSSEEPGTNENHYHHCNEQPNKFWINLFDFYGFQHFDVSVEDPAYNEDRKLHMYINRSII